MYDNVTQICWNLCWPSLSWQVEWKRMPNNWNTNSYLTFFDHISRKIHSSLPLYWNQIFPYGIRSVICEFGLEILDFIAVVSIFSFRNKYQPESTKRKIYVMYFFSYPYFFVAWLFPMRFFSSKELPRREISRNSFINYKKMHS